jgi:hypothetical protein
MANYSNRNNLKDLKEVPAKVEKTAKPCNATTKRKAGRPIASEHEAHVASLIALLSESSNLTTVEIAKRAGLESRVSMWRLIRDNEQLRELWARYTGETIEMARMKIIDEIRGDGEECTMSDGKIRMMMLHLSRYDAQVIRRQEITGADGGLISIKLSDGSGGK